MRTKLIIGQNDLATINPKLVEEWDFEKNDFSPESVTAGSSRKVWWKCKNGHSWPATIASRNSGVGCSQCSKKLIAERIRKNAVSKSGNVFEANPMLSAEWDYSRNEKYHPAEVSPQSHLNLWWICSVCGNSWQAIVRNRVKGRSKCPECLPKKIKPILKQKKKIIPLTLNEQLMMQWDYEKNTGICPSEISFSSHKGVWWKCKNKHEWKASPNHRAKGRGCPYCCANPLVLKGENDLATVNPGVAVEWDYEGNSPLLPSDVTSKSSKRVWWRCALGHTWKTSPNHRCNGSGCPYCAKGRQTSFPEQAIYYYVLQSYPDAINGYTEPFQNHGMELDIFIPSLNIGIEYDGEAFHRTEKQKSRDVKKYQMCSKKGITLIRIKEKDDGETMKNCDHNIVVGGLDSAIFELSRYGVHISNVDTKRDRKKIDSLYFLSKKENSLEAHYPLLASEWNYEKNNPYLPSMFEPSSNQKVWWKCSLKHEWEATIDSRTRGTGCPYCSNNRILPGFNDLASRRPDLLSEWDFEKNIDVDPYLISVGSGKKVWWKCQNKHSWEAEISSRNKGAGCRKCHFEKVKRREPIEK